VLRRTYRALLKTTRPQGSPPSEVLSDIGMDRDDVVERIEPMLNGQVADSELVADLGVFDPLPPGVEQHLDVRVREREIPEAAVVRFVALQLEFDLGPLDQGS